LAGWAEDGKLTLHPTRKVARIWMSARSVVAAMMVSKAAKQVALTAP
jgi:hypothetical protein